MSGQNTLVVIATDGQVKRPSHIYNWQVYRDTAVAGSGTYKAMNMNGFVEIIGGPGSGITGTNVESGTFTKQAGDFQTVVPTVNQAKIITFIAQTGAGAGSSNGTDDGTNHAALSTNPIGVGGNANLTKSIDVSSGIGVGSQGEVSAIGPNSFTVDWTNTGGGSVVNVVWFAITD